MIKDLIHDFSRLFFPHQCAGCGTNALNKETQLCLHCLHELPVTNFHLYAGNPIEQHFTATVPLVSGTSYCYFAHGGMVQHVLHQFKYKGRKDIGLQMGRLMGQYLAESNRFNTIDALVPLPLHPSRERKRGYNQSMILCQGMAEVVRVPIIEHAVNRITATASQTRKNRMERWQNMQGQFRLANNAAIAHKHLLLVDDVFTTGATLGACAQAFLKADGVRLSIATLAYADQ